MHRLNTRQATRAAAVLIFLVAVAYDLGLQSLMRHYAFEGIYFQAWSSEDMVQTVSIRDLQATPLTTLLNIHIQPPVFDTLRALLSQLWPAMDPFEVLRRVDAGLYLVWAAVLGLLEVVIFLWISDRAGSAIGLLTAVLFLLHPAVEFYATFLDTTLLSAFLVAWLYYLLWKIRNRQPVSVFLLSGVTLLLFFTRSIFQLPFIALFAVCLSLVGLPWRRALLFLLLTGVVSGLYIAKQYRQFGISSTSSFEGLNLEHSIGDFAATDNSDDYLKDPLNLRISDSGLPDVLTSTTKLNGHTNFNNINYLDLDRSLFARYLVKLRTSPPTEILQSYAENLAIYFQPSSARTDHIIVDSLPWTRLYNLAFSTPVLPILLLIACAAWLVRGFRAGLYSQSVGLLLPAVYIFLVSILFEKGENMRFKFFLEPVMFIFLASQLPPVARAVQQRWDIARLRLAPQLRWLGLGGLFVISLLLLFLGLYRNQWSVVREKKFKDFQTDSESLVIARMVESRQNGVFSENGLLGWGDANPLDLNQSDYAHQYDVYLNGLRFQDYALYKSVSGTQGMLFSALDGLSPLTPAVNLRNFRVLVSLFFALSLALLVLWVCLEFGWLAAGVILASTLVSQWITLFGRNLFYFIGASFLPLALMALFLAWEERSARFSNRRLALLAFGAIFFKCMMNGYDFIIPALAMPVIPVVYYGIRSRWDRTVFLKRLGILGGALLLAVAISLLILAAQLQISQGSVWGGFASLLSTFSRRSYGDPSLFPSYADSLRADPWSVLWTYISEDRAVEVLGLRFLDIIILFALATLLYVALDAIRARRLPDRHKAYALIAATWISILSPISWFLIFKGQAYVHTFTNYLAWHMPFALFGYTLSGYVAAAFLQTISLPRPSPSGPAPFEGS